MCSVLSIPSESLTYDKKFAHRGICLVICNSSFKNRKLSDISSHEHDLPRVKECFNNLGFTVKTFLNETRSKIIKEFDNASKDEMNGMSQCFACVVMTHGNLDKLAAYDNHYEVSTMLDYFNGTICQSLVGKPKIFIIQACRGDRKDEGATVGHRDDTDTQYYKISINSDFLILYSSFFGYKSYGNINTGFFSQFNSVFNPCPKDVDVISLMCRVNRLVSYQYENNKDESKQTPCIVSTFTRQLFFDDIEL